MKRAWIIALAGLLVLVLGAGAYVYHRLSRTVEAVGDLALAESGSDTLSRSAIVISVIGQGIAEELNLTPEQERRLEKLRPDARRAAVATKARSPAGASPDSERLAEVERYRRQEMRDSVRAALTRAQWKVIQARRSPPALIGKDWRAYAEAPFVRGILRALDLTPAQKRRISALAGRYGPRLIALMADRSRLGRRERLRALIDEAWEKGYSVLRPDQRARFDRYLAAHEQELESGLRAVWLQGL